MACLKRLLAVALALVPTVARAAPVSMANQVCPPAANPCIVSTKFDVAAGAVLDFGLRALEIAAGGALNVGFFSMTIKAGSVIVRPDGALRAAGGSVTVVSQGNITIEAAGSARGLVDAALEDGGVISLCTPSCVTGLGGGTIQIDGDLKAQATGGFGFGGLVELVGNLVTISETGRIDVTGGGEGGGGSIDVFAEGNISVNGLITAAGGSSDGGDVTLDSGTDVITTAEINVNGRLGASGSGFAVDIFTTRHVSIGGLIDGRGRGNFGFGGDGADVFILSEMGDVTVTGPIMVDAGPPDGFGGGVDLITDGGDIVQTGAVTASSPGNEGLGGDVGYTSTGAITVGSVDATGGLEGGSFTAYTLDDFTVTGLVDISGTGALLYGGGTIDIQSCALTVGTTARLKTIGPNGTNVLHASGAMLVEGTLMAGGSNLFEYRSPALPPVIAAGAVITPDAQIVLNTLLVPCGGFPPTTTTTSTTVPSTTTTTTLGGGTTTTSPATTTTAPPTTTTTTVPATTTTTTTAAPTTTTRPPTTTTSTTLPAPECSAGAPGACEDGDGCTLDSCGADGLCVHEQRTEYDAVGCRLEALREVIDTTPAADLGGTRAQRRLGAKVTKTGAKLAAARIAPPARVAAKLKRAGKLLGGFMSNVDRGEQNGKIRGPVAEELRSLASEAASLLQPLIAAATP